MPLSTQGGAVGLLGVLVEAVPVGGSPFIPPCDRVRVEEKSSLDRSSEDTCV